MTCYANPMIMMQSQFDQSMLTASQLQDEIAKTFLYPGVADKEQYRAIPRFQQHDAVFAPGHLPTPSSGPSGNLNIEASDCNPLPLDKKRTAFFDEEPIKPFKKQWTEAAVSVSVPTLDANDHHDQLTDPPFVPASDQGITTFAENDVLSGRGGGTNVHPGNRNFRDLINMHRRDYLKAKKNDKPDISRAIVRAVRCAGGRFLKKDEKANVWLEIGDTQAREKTSQALRQRAPEMRRLMFETEREEAHPTSQEQLQQMLVGGMGRMNPALNNVVGAGVNDLNSYGGGMNNLNAIPGTAEAVNELSVGMPSGFTFPAMNKNVRGGAAGQNSYSMQFFKDD
jgi:hypothetical protein